MPTKIRKAVLPVAGLGTRFLPASKTVPKELLPIVDRPILTYILDEIIASGIETVVLISGRGKSAIEDFFDTSFELEKTLEKKGQHEILKRIQEIKNCCDVVSIRQKEALGLGHAVLVSEPVVGTEAFALLLGDEILTFDAQTPPATKMLMETYQKTEVSTVAVMQVQQSEVSKYGIIATQSTEPPFRIQSVVEKPSIYEAPSQWALPGRYVFHSRIFHYLKETKPGRNGEIQLSDGMAHLAQKEGLNAVPITNRRYDTGDPLGYLKANVTFGLNHPEVGPEFREFVKNLNIR